MSAIVWRNFYPAYGRLVCSPNDVDRLIRQSLDVRLVGNLYAGLPKSQKQTVKASYKDYLLHQYSGFCMSKLFLLSSSRNMGKKYDLLCQAYFSKLTCFIVGTVDVVRSGLSLYTISATFVVMS